jgi:hypothetical protein
VPWLTEQCVILDTEATGSNRSGSTTGAEPRAFNYLPVDARYGIVVPQILGKRCPDHCWFDPRRDRRAGRPRPPSSSPRSDARPECRLGSRCWLAQLGQADWT